MMKGEQHIIARNSFKWLTVSYLSVLFIGGMVYLCCFHNYYFLFVEQLQVFRLDALYQQEFMSSPGGIAAYIGNFLTQFYIINRVGGLMVVLFLAVLLLLMYLFVHKSGPGWLYLPLLCIPCIAVFYCFFDINTRAGLLIALFITFSALYLTNCIHNTVVRRCCTVILVPCLYWMTGAGVFVYAVLCGINELKSRVDLSSVLITVFSLLFSLSMPYMAQRLIILNEYEAWMGISFYNFSQMPLWNYIAILTPVVILTLITILQSIKTTDVLRKSLFSLGILAGVCLVVTGYTRKNNPRQTALYCWDYHLKHENWIQLVSLAGRESHYDPLFINMANLALAKTGQLTSLLFHFPQQPDAAGLWTSNYYPMTITGEIYYQLDMPQVARSFFFMANTQSPNGQSPYLYKRLAEIELMTDNERIAEKYVSSLANTLFYKEYAAKMQAIINNGQLSIELQEKRKNRPANSGFFAAEFKYNLLVQYHEHPDNTFVRDYLLAQCMLENDFATFFKVLNEDKVLLQPNDLPVACQEFILMYAYLINDNSLVNQYSIKQSVVKSFYDYLQTDQKKSFAQTYWFYAQFINRIKS